MSAWEQNSLSGRVFIDGGGSATAFAAITGGRWHLTGWAVGWQNMTSSATIGLLEIDSTNSGTVFSMQTSTTGGWANIILPDHGYIASSSYSSRLVMNTGAIGGTVTGLFTGFSTGQ